LRVLTPQLFRFTRNCEQTESDTVAGTATIADLQAKGFEVHYLSHASAILMVDFPDVLIELCSVLLDVTIPIEEIIAEPDAHARRGGRSEAAWSGVSKRYSPYNSPVRLIHVRWPSFEKSVMAQRKAHLHGTRRRGRNLPREQSHRLRLCRWFPRLHQRHFRGMSICVAAGAALMILQSTDFIQPLPVYSPHSTRGDSCSLPSAMHRFDKDWAYV
jgi:hypothetical protein